MSNSLFFIVKENNPDYIIEINAVNINNIPIPGSTVLRKIISDVDLPIGQILYTEDGELLTIDDKKVMKINSYYFVTPFTQPTLMIPASIDVKISEEIKKMILDESKYPVDLFK